VATGSAAITYAGKPVALDRLFARLSVRDSLVVHAGLTEAQASDAAVLHAKLKSAGRNQESRRRRLAAGALTSPAELQFGLFEAVVEAQLWQPTFIIDYPVEARSR
jgi:lysyl-tRNA synthetase class 2